MFHTMRSVVGSRLSVALRWARRGGYAAALAALIVGGSSRSCLAVSDDFSDLNDTANPAWAHISGNVASTGQAWDASTGQYRLTAPNNGFPQGGGLLGYVASHTGPSFTNVRVSADFVQPATGLAFGIGARINGSNAFNSLTGYGYAYEPLAAGGLGEMVLYRMTGGNIADIGSQQVTLDLANKDYTFILDVIGTQLHGQVYEIGGGLVGERFATDPNYLSGTSGVFGYSNSFAGVITDFTIDNFQARVPEPAASLLIACGLGGAICLRRRSSGRR
jgi:hypothetical protein